MLLSTDFSAASAGLARDALAAQTRRLGLLFFLSGFAALIYQLIWQRSLFRILGVNIEAVTIVVTAFMVGLGLGSLAGGALSKRLEGRAIPLLAAIETLTAIFGVFSLSIFERVGAMAAGAPLPVVAGVALALVLVPTLLMGATLPILVAHLARTSGLTGQSVGYLYFVNTIGAAAACLAGAVAIFPYMGMQASILLAVGMNAVVAVSALLMHFSGAASSSVVAPAHAGAAPRMALPLVLGLGALGGFVSLSCEIFLVRILSFASGGLAYAFALTLAAFLAGVASGSRAAGEAHALPAEEQSSRIAGELAAGLAAVVFCLPALRWLGTTAALQLAIALTVAFIVARALGLLLPWLAEHGAPAGEDTGVRVSWLYVANIVGSAAGSVLTGFVLMNALTLTEIAFVLAALFVVTLVAFAFATGFALERAALKSAVAFSIVGAFAMPALSAGFWDRLLFKDEMASSPAIAEIVENRSGVIAVTSDGAVYGNGMYDGRFNTDLLHDGNGVVRPFALSLLHPAPRRVLMIGLSSGSWARVLASHAQVESLKVVEINPGYVALASRHAETASLATDPKVVILADDGRRWLASHPDERFDAIVSNTTFHYRANISNLLSQEFMALATAHLAPGGVFFFNTTMADRALRTGCLSAPHGLRFTNHLAISLTPIAVDFARWRAALLAYRIDGKPVLDEAKPEEAAKLATLMGYEKSWRADSGLDGQMESCASILRRTDGRAPITDDNMGTEWRAPLGLD